MNCTDVAKDGRQHDTKGCSDAGRKLEGVQFIYDGCTDPEHGKVVAHLRLILQGEVEDKGGDPDKKKSQVWKSGG